MTLRNRAVLWDMDGTLIDSADYHWIAWRDVLAGEGFELTRDRFAESFGRRNDATLRAYFGEDFPLEEIDRIGAIKEARYRDLVRTRGVEFLPGVYSWLQLLKSGGWRQALASSAELLNIEAVLESLKVTGFFDAIVSAEDVQTGKPDPAVFLKAADRVSTAYHRCVVVEDAPAGVEAAHLAGMHAVGVQSSHSSLSADVVVRTLEELDPGAFDSLVSP
jgi:HAD superfamily hydrolase (TIGR01509 family)